MIPNFPTVLVEWIDSQSFTEQRWRHLDEYENQEPILCRTVGMVVKRTAKVVVIVLSVSPAAIGAKPNADGSIVIPRAMITKWVVLVPRRRAR